jgi:hypothetical protein
MGEREQQGGDKVAKEGKNNGMGLEWAEEEGNNGSG